ncbi:MAG: ABC transporter ATP-binding protein [Gammaproteobacteria bacterium]
MTAPLLQIRDLHKAYVLDGVTIQALRRIDLNVEPGEFVAIMGPSGSGKSTLMHILGCLDVPDSGSYRLNGNDITHMDGNQLAALRNHEIGFVFQNFNLLPRTSALENVETPLIYAGTSKSARRQQARAALERMGLGDRLYHLPNQLSGGQAQRVAIARALVTRPSLLLADEPTGNVDTATSIEIMALLDELNQQENLTIVLITHEPVVAEHAQRRLFLRDGQLEARV